MEAVNTVQKENETKPRTWVKTGKDILDLGFTKVPTLLDPIIPKYGAMSLAGSSDLGKSYLLLQLGDAIINGDLSFLGFPLNVTNKSVIYLSTEDDDYGLCPRLTNMSKNRNDKKAYENLRVIFDSKDLINRLDLLLAEKPADLVIIDTFSDIFDGDMNQANRVRGFIQKFKELAFKHKTLIVFNHHCGKKNDYRAPHKDNLLGSQGFESSMRTVLELRKDFTVPTRRHLCVVKGNYLDETFKASSFVLDFNFEDGFNNLGTRVNFESLAKSESANATERETTKKRVHQLNSQGLSYIKIAEKLNGEGVAISKSTVGNMCKENPAIQLPIGNKMDGQEKAA